MPPRKKQASPPIVIESESDIEVESMEDAEDMFEDMFEDEDMLGLEDEDDEVIANSSSDEEITSSKSSSIPVAFGKNKLAALMAQAKRMPSKNTNQSSDSDSDSDSGSDMEEVSTTSSKTKAMRQHQEEEERRQQAQKAKEAAVEAKRQSIEAKRRERAATKEVDTSDNSEFLSMDLLQEVEEDDNSKFEELMRKRRLGVVDLNSAPKARKLNIDDFSKPKKEKEAKFKHGNLTVQARPSAGKNPRHLLAQLAQSSCRSSAAGARHDLLYSKRVIRESSTKSVSLSGKKSGAPLADFAVATSFRGKKIPKK